MQGTSVYTWDAANRLTLVSSGTLTTTFEYDGLGNRVAQTVDGIETRYTLDVADGLPEVLVATTGGATMRYVQVQGQILAQQEAGVWAYVLPDHLGSVRQLVDGDGQVSLAQSYDPFGGSFESAGSGASEFGYTGEWWQTEAELLYLRARYYDPRTGRFLSKDPWPGVQTNPMSLQSYLYASDNPVMFVDPLGLYNCSTWPVGFRWMCWLIDTSPEIRRVVYKGMVSYFLARGWTDAAFTFSRYLVGSGEDLYFGSRLVGLIERDAESHIRMWRTGYLTYAAHQMRGKAGALPVHDRHDFLSNAPGIPESYAATVYPISRAVFIALGGFWLERQYYGTVDEASQGKYHILLWTKFAVDKWWNFERKNPEMHPGMAYEDMPENPPVPVPIFGLGNVYFPDEWGEALENDEYARRYHAKGEWIRAESLIAQDRNCNGWDVDDIVGEPKPFLAWLPTSVNPTSSPTNAWFYGPE